ncbi:MAG: polyprenyl diphosphate synthase [Candidatus Paceibacterota bacterium]|jgi:undecaprenyl diphosphate synthase
MNLESIPKCVGIIMDGNRRWAKTKNLPVVEGHRAGGETLKQTIRWAKKVGVRHIIFYTFSTENWQRPQTEVVYLLNLIGEFLKKELENFSKEGGSLHFVGDLSKFSADLQNAFKKSTAETAKNADINVYFALNYGGRQEILSAVKKIVVEKPNQNDISEEYFNKFLQTYPMPDPDLIIRTSGEERLSGFLPWQGVYSELFFIKTYWPDFSEKEFLDILAEFATRQRRRGK